METRSQAVQPRHPMRVVVRRTGLSPDVLRVWERRYGVVKPVRSAGGQRLYSDADIERLRLLHRAVLSGRSIGQMAALPLEELVALVEQDEAAEQSGRLPGASRGLPSAAERYLATSLRSIEALDASLLERTLRHAALSMSTTPLVDEVVVPLLERIGALWAEGVLRPAHEHLASAVIGRVLSWVMQTFEATDTAPAVVVATPAGELHELGAMLVATTAATEEWRVLYLGADLPAEDIAAVARRADARAVALSLVYPNDGARLTSECRRLAQSLPKHVELVLGGAAALANASTLNAAGARVLADLASFRALLRTVAAEGQST